MTIPKMNLNGLIVGIVTNTSRFVGGVEQVNEMMTSMFNSHGIKTEVISRELLNYESILYKLRNRLHGQHRIVSRYFNRNFTHKSDIVICNGEYSYGIKHSRAVASFHGCYYGYANAIKDYISKRSFNGLMHLANDQKTGAKGKYVVADSMELARVLFEQGVKTDRVINNAVDSDLFCPCSPTKKLDKCLYVGAYDYFGKGFDVLGEVADLGVYIDCITSRRPSHPKIGWLSSIPNKDLPAYYSKYKFLLFPSRFEGSGLVAAEAMSCGTPVIMSKVGLGRELMQEIPAFVIDEPWDKMAGLMCERMKLIESDYQAFANAARGYVLKYHNYADWECNWLEVISFLMNQ